ncbi:MAG: hypothetical protein ACRENI_02420 [Gemmatimonadaceae bacterium]
MPPGETVAGLRGATSILLWGHMTRFFPRQTVAWKLEEPAAFRKLTLSLLEMALITGVVLRLYRSVVFVQSAGSWLYVGAAFAFGALFLFGMLTLHLGNYPIRQWAWRAPAFAVIEVAAEMLTSIALIALHREPLGTARAAAGDWMVMVRGTLITRVAGVVLFALLLAGIVQLVRYLLLRRENRDSTAAAIHDEHERRSRSEIASPPEL